MKTLILVRHAKSDWGSPTLSDHERPLNERGQNDLPRMGETLAERGISADAILTSTAVRARSTAAAIAAAIGFPTERIVEDEGLYLASASRILLKLSRIPEDAQVAMVFGHNPGLHESVQILAKEAWVPEFPTLAVAILDLQVGFWGELERGCGRLAALLKPRELAS